jgi:hypothetical protein
MKKILRILIVIYISNHCVKCTHKNNDNCKKVIKTTIIFDSLCEYKFLYGEFDTLINRKNHKSFIRNDYFNEIKFETNSFINSSLKNVYIEFSKKDTKDTIKLGEDTLKLEIYCKNTRGYYIPSDLRKEKDDELIRNKYVSGKIMFLDGFWKGNCIEIKLYKRYPMTIIDLSGITPYNYKFKDTIKIIYSTCVPHKYVRLNFECKEPYCVVE